MQTRYQWLHWCQQPEHTRCRELQMQLTVILVASRRGGAVTNVTSQNALHSNNQVAKVNTVNKLPQESTKRMHIFNKQEWKCKILKMQWKGIQCPSSSSCTFKTTPLLSYDLFIHLLETVLMVPYYGLDHVI
jgi:hypothetical protein